MKTRLTLLAIAIACHLSTLTAQAPFAQLKVKEKSGFLGMGGPRIVRLELSNQTREKPATCDNVNAGQYYYFTCSPAGDWQLDADFVKDDLGSLVIYQNEKKTPIDWKSDIVTDSTTTVLLGFPRTFNLYQLFLFQVQSGDAVNQVEFKVPQEYWPGYSFLSDALRSGDASFISRSYRAAISSYERVVSRADLQIFPQFANAREKRTRTFEAYLNDGFSQYSTALNDSQLDQKSKIAKIDLYRPVIAFVVDSLARPAWGLNATDPAISTILDRARSINLQVQTSRDSLQRALDDLNTRWIVEGSVSGKNGFLYQYMIETIATGFASLNFADTAMTDIQIRLPEDLRARLVKHSIQESFDTFVRICSERLQTHLPMFPIDFLPNVRKDTAVFPQPYYSMLKAVNDYYYGNLNTARDEITKIFRVCTESDLIAKYDFMRIMVGIRQHEVSADIVRQLEDAQSSERQKNIQDAQEKYRQLTLVAPNFAYGFFALGRFYTQTGDQIRALFSFQRAYQIDSMYVTAYREAFNQFLKQGNYKPMIDVLSTALQKGNDYWEINYNLGIAYLGDGDPARAIQSFERALSLNPRSYRTNIQLGLAYQSVKNYQKAREYFNNAIGIDATRQEAVDYLTKLNELQRNAR